MELPKSVLILIDSSTEAEEKWQKSLKRKRELLREKQLSLFPDLTAEDVLQGVREICDGETGSASFWVEDGCETKWRAACFIFEKAGAATKRKSKRSSLADFQFVNKQKAPNIDSRRFERPDKRERSMFASGAFDPQRGWTTAAELPLVRDEGGGKIRSRSRSVAMSESVKIRNARERERVKTLNSAYEKLRERLPLTPSLRGKKLSKYETLQNAIEYIHTLEDLLQTEGEEGSFARPQRNIELRKCMANGSPMSSQIAGPQMMDMTLSSSRSSESGFSSNDSNASQVYGSTELSEADCLLKSSVSISICKQDKENQSDFSQGMHPMYAINPVAMSLAASYYTQNTGPRAQITENDSDPYNNLQQQSPYPQSEEYESASFDTQEHVTFKNLNYQEQELKNHFPIHMAADIKTEAASYESNEPISFGTYE